MNWKNVMALIWVMAQFNTYEGTLYFLNTLTEYQQLNSKIVCTDVLRPCVIFYPTGAVK